MKIVLLALVFASVSFAAHAAEPFCDTGQVSPIDKQLERELDRSDGVTSRVRAAQGRAYDAWDDKLNQQYKKLMSRLTPKEKSKLRKAQRAWLAFRDAETEFVRSPRISEGGTLQPVIVSDLGLQALKRRVCQLKKYREKAKSNYFMRKGT